MTREELLNISKPILFNQEMVKAILEGRKTVTRRVIKPRYKEDEGGFQVITNKATGERWIEKHDWDEGSFDNPRYVNPSYKVGDILYVRETWYCERYYESGVYGMNVCYKADNKIIPCIFKDCEEALKFEKYKYKTGWQPALFMPKEAARIFLKVTAVRVDRLQDIDRLWDNYDKEGMRNPKTQNISIAMQERFIDVWDSTIKKKDFKNYSWEANPWVWVIEFERVMFE